MMKVDSYRMLISSMYYNVNLRDITLVSHVKGFSEAIRALIRSIQSISPARFRPAEDIEGAYLMLSVTLTQHVKFSTV